MFSVYSSSSSSRYPYGFKYYKQSITYLSYDTEVFYNDTQDKVQKVSRRVKNYLQGFIDAKKHCQVLVVDTKEKSDLFNAKKLSSLELPKINRGGAKKTSGEITVTELNNYGQHRRNVSLKSTIGISYLYLAYDQSCYTPVINFCKKLGYVVCRLSKDSIRSVKGHENFTDFNEWKSNFKLTKDQKNSIYFDIQSTPTINFLEVEDDKLMELKKLASTYISNNITYRIPTEFYTNIIEETIKVIESYNIRIAELVNYKRTEYTLLSHDKKTNTEYINALYGYRKKLHSEK
jgi:hypothetical protein